jgi:hypothetical protein
VTLLELNQYQSRSICYGHRSSGATIPSLGAVLAERKLLNVSTRTASDSKTLIKPLSPRFSANCANGVRTARRMLLGSQLQSLFYFRLLRLHRL